MAAKEQPKRDVGVVSTIAACLALIAARRESLSWGFLAPALCCSPLLHHLPWLEDDRASFGHLLPDDVPPVIVKFFKEHAQP